MRIPVSYVVFRSVVVAIMASALLLLGLGLAGYGPFGAAAGVGARTLGWLSEYTGVPL